MDWHAFLLFIPGRLYGPTQQVCPVLYVGRRVCVFPLWYGRGRPPVP